jgi:hypothetical protein
MIGFIQHIEPLACVRNNCEVFLTQVKLLCVKKMKCQINAESIEVLVPRVVTSLF